MISKKTLLICSSTLLLGACASTHNPDDPLEGYNRAMYKVNTAIDDAVLKPVAKGYRWAVPDRIKTCISNIFGNLDDVWSGINSTLQLRGRDSLQTFSRVFYNSTVGLGGCIDVASMSGLERRSNDFGTTLGVWGIGSGPFVTIPIKGPSNFRDTAAMGPEIARDFMYLSPWSIDEVPVRNSLVPLQYIDLRYQLLDADELASDIALDKYSFIRDAYMQNRNAKVKQKKAPVVVETRADKEGIQAYQWDAGGDTNLRFKDNGFVPYHSGTLEDDTGLPSYDDPDADSGASSTGSDVPTYDDPEADSAAPAAPSASASSDVPQYDDPGE
ncbi:MlaA family lipoprotein [Brackiella oedipodis]|uniref:MlaA family lipoprotein n=1 Tax=Brackiella oedipodis TaxID=124225 RepID=UPI00048DB2B8|nr:VacJ family lipoprotein [Brackiella oedipodis]